MPFPCGVTGWEARRHQRAHQRLIHLRRRRELAREEEGRRAARLDREPGQVVRMERLAVPSLGAAGLHVREDVVGAAPVPTPCAFSQVVVHFQASPREDSFHSFFLVKPESVLDVPYFTTRTKRGTLPQRSSYIYCLYGSMLFHSYTRHGGWETHTRAGVHIYFLQRCIFAHQHAHARAPHSHSAGH